jgi:Nucleotidyl transferase AbiEii toxin, Type IV TA system
MANSRMKDFYDIWILAKLRDFDGPTLTRALTATFRRRRTRLPSEAPTALSPTFAEGREQASPVEALRTPRALDVNGPALAEVVAFLRDFLMPPTRAAAAGNAFELVRPAGGPWRAGGNSEAP